MATLFLCLFACGSDTALREGYTAVVFEYNGAEGRPAQEVQYVKHNDAVTLATDLTREGYGFVGWKHNGVLIRDAWRVGTADKMTFSAIFERDYKDLDATCAVWNNEGKMVDYPEGEYPSINVKVLDVVVKAGYKATFYSKDDYKGDRADVVCYKGFLNRRAHSLKVEKIATEEEKFDGALTDDDYAYLLKKYAPKIWWAKGEEYFASSVEDAMAHLTRVDSGDGYYYNYDPVGGDPYYVDDYLHGKKEGGTIYGFAVKKEYVYLNLCYYIYEPYNYGKKILGTLYGNHVGDWEHVSVALRLEETEEGTVVQPLYLETSYHDWRDYTPFDQVEKEGTHPVAYIAEKSHGTWPSAGTHVYKNAVVLKLSDSCSKGTAWDTWNSIETYVYDAKEWTGRGVGTTEWNRCFDKDYQSENGLSAIHWGNKGMPQGVFYKYFVTGPTSPENKVSLYNYYTMNKPQTYEV